MDWTNILGLVSCACVLVILVIDWYTNSEKNIYSIVSKLIALAEETGLPGREKMEMVVNGLYAIVPVAFKKILTKEKLQEIAQKVFDQMKSYALDFLAQKAKEQNQSHGIEVERPADFGKESETAEESETEEN
jgi:hypothetical protein